MSPLLLGLPPACCKLLGVLCQLHNGAMAELRQMCRAMQTVLTEDACGNQVTISRTLCGGSCLFELR